MDARCDFTDMDARSDIGCKIRHWIPDKTLDAICGIGCHIWNFMPDKTLDVRYNIGC